MPTQLDNLLFLPSIHSSIHHPSFIHAPFTHPSIHHPSSLHSSSSSSIHPFTHLSIHSACIYGAPSGARDQAGMNLGLILLHSRRHHIPHGAIAGSENIMLDTTVLSLCTYLSSLSGVIIPSLSSGYYKGEIIIVYERPYVIMRAQALKWRLLWILSSLAARTLSGSLLHWVGAQELLSVRALSTALLLWGTWCQQKATHGLWTLGTIYSSATQRPSDKKIL